MDLLNKLSSVTVSQDSRITEKDRLMCEAHQQAYDEAKKDIESLYSLWMKMKEKQEELLFEAIDSVYSRDRYINIDGIKDYEITRKLECLPMLFIAGVSSYFSHTYRVEIDTDKIADMLLPKEPDRHDFNEKHHEEYRQKLRKMSLKYQEVLEQIFNQFDGRGFTDVAISQIKQAAHNSSWDTYDGKPKYEVKNNTIKFTGYFCSASEYSGRFSVENKMKKVLTAAALFETGVVGQYPRSMTDSFGYSSRDCPDVYFYDCEKVVSMRMYKNGRVDLKFSTKETANQFAENYLGNVC